MTTHSARMTSAAIAALFLCLVQTGSARAGGPSPEQQLAGKVAGVLRAVVSGEFTETQWQYRKPVLVGPICKAADFERLKAAAGEVEKILAVVESCKLDETKIGRRQVETTIFLPEGYCKPIKEVFESILLAYRSVGETATPTSVTPGLHFTHESAPTTNVAFTYKNSRYYASHGRDFLIFSEIQSVCESDGSLRVVTLRKKW